MATRADMMWVGYMPGGTLSRRDQRKVAQHFSAGLALCNATRPGRDDRSPLTSDKSNWWQKASASIVPWDGPVFAPFPSTKVLGYFHSIPPGSLPFTDSTFRQLFAFLCGYSDL